MIVDHLAAADVYRHVHPRVWQGIEFLRTTNLLDLPTGKHVIDGDRLFALVQDYETRPDSEVRFEAHQRFIDVQCVARGVERMGYGLKHALEVEIPYDAEKDIAWYRGQGETVQVSAGMFTVFFPHDAHRPGIAAGGPAPVRKIVVKAAAD